MSKIEQMSKWQKKAESAYEIAEKGESVKNKLKD